MKHKPETMEKLDNEWHWGPTGTGKSRHVRETYPDAYIKSNNLNWDGYNKEDVVIIEEMGPNQISGHWLKMWADHYSFKADAKFTMMQIRPKKIIITSNYTIRECYPAPQDYEPLERRFKVHHYPLPIGK